jgi:ATP-binding protein involved in chromosome partitioning
LPNNIIHSHTKTYIFMELDKQAIIDVLRTVADPITGNDIIAAKLVENLQTSGNNISFTLMLLPAHSPHKSTINFTCQAALQNRFPDCEVHIHIETKAATTASQVESILPQVGSIIAVASGKGGVGKSTVAVNLALGLRDLGARVGLIDADLYGPSLPTMFGLQGARPRIQDVNGVPKIVPIEKYGIQTMSIGYIVEPDQAVVLRGPRLGGILKQFFQDCLWQPMDYLILDLPPGTGDIQLSIVQTVPVTGVVMVTTPQQVAIADAIKGMNMFLLPNVNVPILGVVENMAYFTPAELPNNKYYIFGQGGGKQLAKLSNSMLLGQVPIVQSICEGGDSGKPAIIDNDPILKTVFTDIAKNVARQVALRNEFIDPTKRVEVKS